MDELKNMIALLKRADFDPTDIDTDLHKRVADAIQDGFIRRFDMRVNSRDGDQDLSMWMRDVEQVVREIMRDERKSCVTRQDEDPHVVSAVHGQRPYSTGGKLGYVDIYRDILIYLDIYS